MIAKRASGETHVNKEYTQKTLRILGYVPFTRAVMDDPDILSSALEEVQAERGKYWLCAGIARVFLKAPHLSSVLRLTVST